MDLLVVGAALAVIGLFTLQDQAPTGHVDVSRAPVSAADEAPRLPTLSLPPVEIQAAPAAPVVFQGPPVVIDVSQAARRANSSQKAPPPPLEGDSH